MRKIIISLFAFIASFNLSAQQMKIVEISDWNNIGFSGFVESTSYRQHANSPGGHQWYWGFNALHISSNPDSRHCAQIAFAINGGNENIPAMYIRSTNDSGMATWAKVLHSKGNHAIDGKLIAKEVEIKINTGADFVFDSNYELKSLAEVETFINENKHLPEIPSEKEIQENGLNLNEMQIKLLQKVEELTLYIIQQNKKIEKQQALIEELQENRK